MLHLLPPAESGCGLDTFGLVSGIFGISDSLIFFIFKTSLLPS